MAITVTHKDGATVNPPGTSPTTASIAFQNNALYLVSVVMRGGTTPDVTAISGGGITWTKTTTTRATAPFMAQYRGLTTSGATTGALTMTVSGTPTQFKYTVTEFTGVDTTTPIVQTAAFTGGTNQGIGTVTLSSFDDAANNVAFGMFATNQTESDMPADTGHTRLFFDSSGTPTGSMQTEYMIGEDTSVSCDWTTTTNVWSGGANEIAMAATAAATRKLGVVAHPQRW